MTVEYGLFYANIYKSKIKNQSPVGPNICKICPRMKKI